MSGGEQVRVAQPRSTLERTPPRRALWSRPHCALDDVPASVHALSRTPAERLDRLNRKYIDAPFGHDFGQVRVRADGGTAASARDVHALVYTVGSQLAFGRGHYVPRTLQRQAAPAAENAPAVKYPTAARVAAAEALVEQMKKLKTKYRQEDPRDWDARDLSDCSKFVQLALEDAGQKDLFGREEARTAAMQEVVKTRYKGSFRLTDPKVGDLMMWGGHVGIVTQIIKQGGVDYLVYASMGTSGASYVGTYAKKEGGVGYWLKAADTASMGPLGLGGFLGFWTPP